MVIINGYAINNGKKQQQQKAQKENIEQARKEIFASMEKVKDGYNKFLTANNMQEIQLSIIDNNDTLTFTFSHNVIDKTEYHFTIKGVN